MLNLIAASILLFFLLLISMNQSELHNRRRRKLFDKGLLFVGSAPTFQGNLNNNNKASSQPIDIDEVAARAEIEEELKIENKAHHKFQIYRGNQS